MPSTVQSAVGTALNFTPQPEQLKDVSPAGVSAGSFAPSSAGQMDAELASNLSKLSDALGGYEIRHEQYLDQKAAYEAKQLINGASSEDIKKMDAIDLAQSQGMLHPSDNPYFQAHANELRGSYLASQAKQAYDQQFEFTPAKSADDERARWTKFQQDWKNDNVTNGETEALNKGYYETSKVAEKGLVDSFLQKDYQDQSTVAMAGAQSKLGALINNTNILNEPKALAAGFNSAMGDVRLMGLPMATRVKLLDNAVQQAMRTGHIEKKLITAVLPQIKLGYDADGSEVTADKVLNIQTLTTEATAYADQFYTKDKSDFIDKYVTAEDFTGAQKAIEDMMKTDPDHAPAYGKLLPTIQAQIKALQAQREMERRAAAKANAKYTMNEVQMRSQVSAWINGRIGSSQQVLNALNGIPEEQKNAYFKESLNYYMNSKMSARAKVKYINKLATCPGFETYRKNISAQFEADLRNIRPDSAESSRASMLMDMRRADPANFSSAFGTTLDTEVATLNDLSDMYGGQAEGIKVFADWNSMSDDEKAQYKQQADSTLSYFGYTLEGIHPLGGGITPQSIRYDSTAELKSRIDLAASIYMHNGMSPYNAVNKAAQQVVTSHTYYHGALFPRGTYSNLGTSDNEGAFKSAMDAEVYEYAQNSMGDVAKASQVSVKFDEANQQFLFSDDYGTNIRRVSLNELRDNAKVFAKGASATAENNTNMTAADLPDYNSLDAQRNKTFGQLFNQFR